ncbi:hypothetical protein ACIQFU_19720 [Streptomyces sp. NPDC093065]|uniref:hypothetical protein n=1 Tax=Streptomyces sp. NPDC093065 TaxID=3366021 RepID=UPI003820F943
MNKLPIRVTGIALALLAVAGCGTGDEGSGDTQRSSNMNMQEAADEADTLIHQTFSAVKPPVEWTHDASDHGSCGGDSTGMGDVTRRAVVMTKVSAERRGALLGIIERHWKKKGHKITDVNPNKEFPEIYAESGDGLLRMSLIVGGEGQFFLDVQTSCVPESSVTGPTTKGHGHSYYGEAVPRPNVDDAFWSSERPLPSPSPS